MKQDFYIIEYSNIGIPWVPSHYVWTRIQKIQGKFTIDACGFYVFLSILYKLFPLTVFLKS